MRGGRDRDRTCDPYHVKEAHGVELVGKQGPLGIPFSAWTAGCSNDVSLRWSRRTLLVSGLAEVKTKFPEARLARAWQPDAIAALRAIGIKDEGAMSKKKPAADKTPTTVVADDPDDLKGTLKHIGGSQSDQWNNILFNQTIQTLWLKHFDKDTCDRQYRATVAALIRID